MRSVALHASSVEANPTLDPAFIEGQRRLLSPSEFAAEYLASFTGSAGGFLDLAQVARRSSVPVEVDDVVVGLDPGQRDAFGLVAVGAALDPPVRLAVARVEALDASSFTGAVDEAARIARGLRARVVTDQYAAPLIAERLRNVHGLDVVVTPWGASSGPRAVSVYDAFADLRTRLYEGRLELLDDDDLLRELDALRVKPSGSGWRVESPRRKGSHGDRASALALAVAHCAEPELRIGWLSDEERRARDVEEARRAIDRAWAKRRARLEDSLGPVAGGSSGGGLAGGLRGMPW